MMNRGLVFLFLCAFPLCYVSTCTGQIPVRYQEGITHGFLTLHTTDGRLIAEGEIAQTAKDGVVTSRITFNFKDGSLYDDTTTFSQRGNFRLLKDHVVLKGPAFKQQMESTIDAKTGRVTVHFEKDGKPEKLEKSMELPPDLSNGILFTLVKNLLATPTATVSYLALTPKPTLVKLVFTKEGAEKLKAGSTRQPGARFVMKVELGGLKGVLASILNKKPPDTQMWVVDEEVPTLVASEGPLYGQGPVWRIELVSPQRIRLTTPESR
jgi:hypothetical protein